MILNKRIPVDIIDVSIRMSAAKFHQVVNQFILSYSQANYGPLRNLLLSQKVEYVWKEEL
jgi:hypothetical protein